MEEKQTFGEFLKLLIKDTGMTNTEFYTELGIKKPYFYEILSGKTNPPPAHLQFKSIEILRPSKTDICKFFDLAAKERNEIPADIIQIIKSNPELAEKIRRDTDYECVQMEATWR